MVLIQSKTLTADDAAFRAVVEDVEQTLAHPSRGQEDPVAAQLRPRRLDLEGRPFGARQLRPQGTYEEAILYIDEHVAAIDEVADRHPAFGVESLGTSTDKALDAEIRAASPRRASSRSPSRPSSAVRPRLVVAALIPLLLGVTAVVATMGLLAIASQGIPVSENIMEVVLLVGLAVGVDYALFYMKRERRGAGRGTH